MVPTNTGIFLFSMRRKQNLASALGIQKEIWGNHAFFRDTKASIGGGGGGGDAIHCFVFYCFLEELLLHYF